MKSFSEKLYTKIKYKLNKMPIALRIKEKFRKEPLFPNYICLEITNACNLRCVQCLYRGGTTGHYIGGVGYIPLDFALHVLDQLKPYNSGVMLNGDGEALLHPQFHEIASHAMELKLNNVYFNTNGTLMDSIFIDRFIEYFKGSVSISLDGFKESHERIRRGSSYDVVIKNIEYLLKKIREKNAEIEVSVAYCNYDQPEGERERFAQHWVNIVDSVTVGEVYDKDYKIISEQINRSTKLKRIMCGVPWETFVVRWNGLVVPCSNCFALGDQGDFILGDARHESLLNIWHGDKANNLRERTKKWKLAGTICENCDRWNMYASFDPVQQGDIVITRSGVFTTYRRVRQ